MCWIPISWHISYIFFLVKIYRTDLSTGKILNQEKKNSKFKITFLRFIMMWYWISSEQNGSKRNQIVSIGTRFIRTQSNRVCCLIRMFTITEKDGRIDYEKYKRAIERVRCFINFRRTASHLIIYSRGPYVPVRRVHEINARERFPWQFWLSSVGDIRFGTFSILYWFWFRLKRQWHNGHGGNFKGTRPSTLCRKLAFSQFYWPRRAWYYNK